MTYRFSIDHFTEFNIQFLDPKLGLPWLLGNHQGLDTWLNYFCH